MTQGEQWHECQDEWSMQLTFTVRLTGVSGAAVECLPVPSEQLPLCSSWLLPNILIFQRKLDFYVNSPEFLSFVYELKLKITTHYVDWFHAGQAKNNCKLDVVYTPLICSLCQVCTMCYVILMSPGPCVAASCCLKN